MFCKQSTLVNFCTIFLNLHPYFIERCRIIKRIIISKFDAPKTIRNTHEEEKKYINILQTHELVFQENNIKEYNKNKTCINDIKCTNFNE